MKNSLIFVCIMKIVPRALSSSCFIRFVCSQYTIRKWQNQTSRTALNQICQYSKCNNQIIMKQFRTHCPMMKVTARTFSLETRQKRHGQDTRISNRSRRADVIAEIKSPGSLTFLSASSCRSVAAIFSLSAAWRASSARRRARCSALTARLRLSAAPWALDDGPAQSIACCKAGNINMTSETLEPTNFCSSKSHGLCGLHWGLLI